SATYALQLETLGRCERTVKADRCMMFFFFKQKTAYEIGPNVNDAAIVGGFGNAARTTRSFIGAGLGNVIEPRSFQSCIGAGFSNRIVGAISAIIGGGEQNAIHTNAATSIIGGGSGNTIGTN